MPTTSHMVPSTHFVTQFVVSAHRAAATGCAGTPLGGRVAERLSNKQIVTNGRRGQWSWLLSQPDSDHDLAVGEIREAGASTPLRQLQFSLPNCARARPLLPYSVCRCHASPGHPS